MKNSYLFYTDEKTDNKDFSYLLGFQPSYGMMLFQDMWIWKPKSFNVFLDGRYIDKKNEVDIKLLISRLWRWITGLWKSNIKTIKQKININVEFSLLDSQILKQLNQFVWKWKLFLEKNKIPFVFYDKVINNITNKVRMVDNFLDNVRVYKDNIEVDYIKQAIDIIDCVYMDILSLNKSWKIKWMSELWLRRFIIDKIFEYWWEWESFETIVAFGKNSAIPHHKTWNTIIWDWPLLIDMWAKINNYCSDFTRCMWVGEKTGWFELFNKIYKIVKEANIIAFNSVKFDKWLLDSWRKLKNNFQNLDNIARSYIESQWYKDFFTHSLGHGIGLDVHEKPFVGRSSTEVLGKGMFFTIEPGIYLFWEMGVRYENIVYIYKNGWVLFSKID